MKTVKEIRRDRLLWLIETYYGPYKKGGCKKLAEFMGVTPSTYSQIISRSGGKGMGDRMARSLEIKHGLLEGTMDNPVPGREIREANLEDLVRQALQEYILGQRLPGEIDPKEGSKPRKRRAKVARGNK